MLDKESGTLMDIPSLFNTRSDYISSEKTIDNERDTYGAFSQTKYQIFKIQTSRYHLLLLQRALCSSWQSPIPFRRSCVSPLKSES